MTAATMPATPLTPSFLPALDETLMPITIGRRAATPQEARAINALAAVLDDQPAPPATLFDWSEQKPAPAGLQRIRVKANSSKYFDVTATAMQMETFLAAPAITAAVEPARLIEVRVSHDDLQSDDYTPAFVAPGFERLPAKQTQQPAISTSRDEMLAVAREVQARLEAQNPAEPLVQPMEEAEAIQQVAVIDSMPFGNATLRLFCC